MMRSHGHLRLPTATTVALTLVGYLLTATPAHASEPPSEPACEHPYPCEDDWPEGLEGPFPLREVVQVIIESHDGTPLHGWIGLPEVPDGVRVPVALHSTPYLGWCPGVGPSLYPPNPFLCTVTPDEPTWWTTPAHPQARGWGVDPIRLVERGMATAFFSVRGTGRSGGCVDYWGHDEQLDQVALVEWLGAQPWSNGRVAMGGNSYPGTTPWEAAIHGPEALKTIVTSGIITDVYTTFFTPQGAATAGMPRFVSHWYAGTLLGPLGGGPAHAAAALQGAPERPCPDLIETHVGLATDIAASQRRQAFYDERRLIDGFGDVTAAVLLTQGFRDNFAHVYQESLVWEALTRAPKRMIEGQWGHSFPHPDVATLDDAWDHSTWEELLLAWLDYWLRGVGDTPEHLDTVDYQDSSGRWRRSTAWPPPDARDEAIYLTGDILNASPAPGDRTFRSLPNIGNEFVGAEAVEFPFNLWPALCVDADASAAGVGVAYTTDPLAGPVTIAGNPFAYLKVSSDQPGGIVGVHVVKVPADFECSAGPEPTRIRVVAWGAADLRFHAGGFTAEPFPVNTPTGVRVDLWNGAEVIEAGSRLAVVVSYGEMVPIGWGTAGQPYYPQITVHAGPEAEASHIVLPIVEGSFGGSATAVDYPPRPFDPVTRPSPPSPAR